VAATGSHAESYGDELAVITVTYSPGDVLETFLDSLADATKRTPRVILADNGSTDGAPERAVASREGVELLRTGGNLGYGTAANRALATLPPGYGWVVVANPDIEWKPGSLDDLLDAANRWPRAGSLGPLIREPDGTVYPSARLLPSLGRGIGHALLGRLWPANPWTRSYRQSSTASLVERPAGWLSGSCLLVRRAAFEAIGGFDERYFMYFEDVDLGDRLGQAGWLNVYVPSAEVVHLGGHATSKASERMLAVHHRSTYRYLAGRYRGPWYAPLRLALRGGLEARSWLAVRAARRRAA
jgi:N-acetylglucosaminyl-diphospho-decaprenol L-rhamnosyltransferase